MFEIGGFLRREQGLKVQVCYIKVIAAASLVNNVVLVIVVRQKRLAVRND